ncbi:MAG: nucleotidyltransferase substrate binding protein [Phycisphaerales bacterium]|nr:MAG: nucleotidyltransferase substrate binding protein [Phycisphaerales bacterium]
MKLDLSSLGKAVESLEKTLRVADDNTFMSRLTEDQKEAVRAGVIQNFEFTYELCWKFMRRWLEVNLGSVYVAGVARRQLFRLSAEHRLVSDVDRWMEYHDARSETAHTYDENTAEDVFETAHRFLADAQKLPEALEAHNA